MLTGNDFIILSANEIRLLYHALAVEKSKTGYTKLQKLGILHLVQQIEDFLFKGEGEENESIR